MREDSHIRFGTTRWSLFDQIARGGEAAELALTRLSETYWPAVYAFLRRRGMPREESVEVAQAFFGDVVFGRSLFQAADRSGGRFRSLLLKALKRYLIDRHRRRATRLARLHVSPETIEGVEAGLANGAALDPEHAFDRAWASAALSEAMRRCESHFMALDKPNHWRLFELRVIDPATRLCEPPAYEHLHGGLGFSSPADARAAVQTVRKRLLGFITEVTNETEDGDASELAQILAQAPSPVTA